MTLVTPLDAAHLAAEAEGAHEDARARFYALLMESVLLTPVEPGPEDAAPKPMTFDLADGPVALAFDDDGRMAAFFEAPVDYVALGGRALAAALAQAGLGLGLNLGDAPSATLLPREAVAWLAAEMGGAGAEAEALSGALTVLPPQGAAAPLLAALTERIAGWPGLVAEAWLVRLSDGAEPERLPERLQGRLPGRLPGRLTAVVAPTAAARRGGDALAAALARAAEPFAPPGETVAAGAVAEDHPLLAPARAVGLALHPTPAPAEPPPSPPRPAAPPRLR